MNFASVEKIAAAILYEGYILYPYRPTAIKNRQRWNFGTLYPRVYAEAQQPQEPFRLIAECLMEGGAADATLDLRLQFLRLLPQAANRAPGTDDSVHSLSDPSLAWEEAVECHAEQQALRLDELALRPLTLTPQIKTASELLSGLQIVELQAALTITLEPLPCGALKLRVEVTNVSPLASGAAATREEALPRSLVSAHVLLGLRGAQFISLLDPPELYQQAAAACSNTGVFPVLAEDEVDRSIMLCSPIILYDYPRIAPESGGDFFDGTEMDEMLTLRVLTLTDEEKQQMREGDPRARKILERTEALTPDSMMKVHGAIRGMREIRGETP